MYDSKTGHHNRIIIYVPYLNVLKPQNMTYVFDVSFNTVKHVNVKIKYKIGIELVMV